MFFVVFIGDASVVFLKYFLGGCMVLFVCFFVVIYYPEGGRNL